MNTNEKSKHEPPNIFTKPSDTEVKDKVESGHYKRLHESQQEVLSLKKQLEEKENTIEALTFQTLLLKAYYEQLDRTLTTNKQLVAEITELRNKH